MGATSLKVGSVLFVLTAVVIGAAQASDLSDPVREPVPRMGELSQPLRSAIYKLNIELPSGVPLCGVVESFSSMEWFYVPIDPTTRCEQFSLPMDWEKWPDFIVIGPYLDAPMIIDTLDDYVRKEAFFCAGKNTAEGNGAPRPSDAPTSLASAGKLLLGLDTMTCTRSDAQNGRYAKALLAYSANPNESGRGYMVGAYTRIKNKDAADRLLGQIAGTLSLLK